MRCATFVNTGFRTFYNPNHSRVRETCPYAVERIARGVLSRSRTRRSGSHYFLVNYR